MVIEFMTHNVGAQARPEAVACNDGLAIAFALLKSEQKACSMLACDGLPWLVRDRTFKCPEQIKTDIDTCSFDLNISRHGTKLTDLGKRRDAGSYQICCGLRAQVCQCTEFLNGCFILRGSG